MEDLANFCLDYALRKGASFCEARIVEKKEEVYSLKNGLVESPSFKDSKGIGIRFLVNGAFGFVSSNILNKKILKLKINESIKNTKIVAERNKEKIVLSEEKSYKDKWKVKSKIKFEDISLEEKYDLLFEVERRFKELKKIIPSRFFQISLYTTKTYYANSDGTEIFSIVPRFLFTYSLVAISGKKSEQRYFFVGKSGGWESLKGIRIEEKIVNEGKKLIEILKKGRKIKKQKMDVILSPELVGIAMHECCGHPSEADRILGREGAQAGESYLSLEWLGKEIGSRVVNVIEDPRVKGSFGYYKYDDEGVKAKKRILIKNGRINEFLHNRETAGKFGIKSNAAARASDYDREPIVRMSTTFIQPGNYTFDELIRGVKKGVYIKSFTEWNIDDKRWNQRYVGCESYLIENGKMKGIVRRPVLEITTRGFFSSIDACGKDLDFVAGTCGKGDPMQPLPVWMGGPHIRLRNVLIGCV